MKTQDLVMRSTPLPLLRPALEAPTALSANGRKAFETYLIDGPHKAFALSPDGHFGWQTGKRSTAAASAGALKNCQQSGAHCQVKFIDDAAVVH